MSVELSVRFEGAEELLAKYRETPDRLRGVLLSAMKTQMSETADWSRLNRLSGRPGLNRRSGRLSTSISAKAVDNGNTITGSIGTNVSYGKYHEEGGTFDVKAYVRRSAFNAKGGRTALLTKGGKVRAAASAIKTGEVKAHTITFPQRSFLALPLQTNRDKILENLRKAAMEGLK